MTEHRPLNTAHLPLKLRVEDYVALDAAGAFDGYRKTELLDGGVLFMNAQHRAHARTKSRLHLAIASGLIACNSNLEALVEASVSIPPHDSPEPDIVVTDDAGGDGLLPVAAVVLVIEVSDATLDIDMGKKAALYATAKIPEYWVVDINSRTIHQMTRPGSGDYVERQSKPFGTQISGGTIDGLAVDTTSL